MCENYKPDNLRFSSGRPIELDVYFPSLHLAFEYQGKQHYKNIYSLGDQKMISERDVEKKKLCANEGISLIDVPYWWDGNIDTLAASIHKYRPDLIPQPPAAEPISEIPPEDLITGTCCVVIKFV